MTLQKRFVKTIGFFLVFLMIVFSFSACNKENTPKWDSFKTDLQVEYSNIDSISLYAIYRHPSLCITIKAENLDLNTRKEMSQQIIEFIVSDEGYVEMTEYYKTIAKWEEEFSSIEIDFIDYSYSKEQNSSSIYISLDSTIPRDDIENMRGFVNWHISYAETGTYETIYFKKE